MRNEMDEGDADGAATEGSPAQLVILAGGQDALCIDDLCITGDVRPTDPAASAEVTA